MTNIFLNIIAILIIASAFSIAVHKIVKNILNPPQNKCESGCGSCTTQCQLKQITQKQH